MLDQTSRPALPATSRRRATRRAVLPAVVVVAAIGIAVTAARLRPTEAAAVAPRSGPAEPARLAAHRPAPFSTMARR